MGKEIPKLERNPDYVVFIHRIFHADGQVKPGGLDQILEILKKKGKEVLYLEHPLHPEFHSYSYVRLNNQILHKKNIFPQRVPLRWLGEIWSDLMFMTTNISQPVFALTADPLASFSAFILKKLGKVKDYYFHLIDYSPQRFDNRLFNLFYHYLHQIALKNAKKVGVVSPRIKTQIMAWGTREEKILFLPNSPSFRQLDPYRREVNQRDLYQLIITCAGLDPKFRLEDSLAITAQLKTKFPQAHLIIIGLTETNPGYTAKLYELVLKNHWQEIVKFTGYLPLDQNWDFIGQSGIGIAFYSPITSHIRYGDSLKIREYAALGLPVVTDNLTFTAEEMEKSGAGRIAKTNQEAVEIITRWWQNPQEYNDVRQNGLQWAQKNDKDKLVEQLFNEVLV